MISEEVYQEQFDRLNDINQKQILKILELEDKVEAYKKLYDHTALRLQQAEKQLEETDCTKPATPRQIQKIVNAISGTYDHVMKQYPYSRCNVEALMRLSFELGKYKKDWNVQYFQRENR